MAGRVFGGWPSPVFLIGSALVAQPPDNTAAGGNARGANAVDWQTVRGAASQVASGQEGVIGGGNSNTASGLRTVVAGGNGNTASGTNSAVLGGASNTASGTNGWVLGGTQAVDRSNYGRGAWASGAFAAPGDAQAGEFVLRRDTADATSTRLTANGSGSGSTNTINLPNNATYRLKLLVVAQQTGGSAGTAGDCASWEVNVLMKRGANAAATAIVGGTRVTSAPALAAVTAGAAFAPDLSDAGAAAWTLAIAADTTNGGVAITGTGEANKTIRWVARVMGVEVTA